MPDDLSDTDGAAVVVRNGLSMDLAGNLIQDIEDRRRATSTG